MCDSNSALHGLADEISNFRQFSDQCGSDASACKEAKPSNSSQNIRKGRVKHEIEPVVTTEVTPNNLAAALKLAEHGYPVFPLKPNSKHEYKTGHPLDRTRATTEPAQIISMFAEASARANVGYLVLPGKVVVEADKERGDFEHLPQIGRTRIETSAGGGLHIGYELPADLAHARGEFKWKGIEIKLAGSRIVGAGSVVSDHPYEVIDDTPDAPAPDWLCEAIANHFAMRQNRLAKSAEQKQPVDNERGRRWAEAGLLAECARVREAGKGSRFHTLRSVAFKVGQLAHYIGESTAREQLLAASKHYDDARKVENIIESGLRAGALVPRSPAVRTEKTTYRHAINEMVKLCDASAWGDKMQFRIKNRTQNVRATTVRAALSVILQRAKAANSLDVDMSQRHLAELAHCGKNGAWRVLQALMTAHLLEMVKRSNGVETANRYRLTPKGFLCLQRASLCNSGVIYSHLKESVAGDKNFELHNLSFNGHEFDSTIAQTDGAVSLGIFAHKTLGRAAFVVARALAYRPLSAREIAETTGVNSRTVYSALDKLESNAMVESSGRGKAWRLTNNFTEQAAQVATEFSTQARSTARKFRHAKERMAWRETVEQRKKAREKQLQSSAHEHFVQQERQSVDA